MRVLIIEDEPRLADFLHRGLRAEGHAAQVADSLKAAEAALAEADFDLYLVDRGLPDGDGLDFIRARRRGGDRRPALCLTARDRVDERVAGLLHGADDYLAKPFALAELLARIAAVSRRTGHGSGRVEVADLAVDLEGLRVWRGGEEIALTAQEFRLLRALAENAGRVVSKSRLLELAWDLHHDPGTNVVDVYVSYLRAKIDKNREPKLIHTVRGLGFMLAEKG